MRQLWGGGVSNDCLMLLMQRSGGYTLPFLGSFFLIVPKPIEYRFAIVYCWWVPQVIAKNILFMRSVISVRETTYDEENILICSGLLPLWGNIQKGRALRLFASSDQLSSRSYPSSQSISVVLEPGILESANSREVRLFQLKFGKKIKRRNRKGTWRNKMRKIICISYNKQNFSHQRVILKIIWYSV